MIDTQRHLPHWVPDDVPVFVTWRLAGTLPMGRLAGPEAGRLFVKADQALDQDPAGPRWLNDGRVADMIVTTLRYGAEERRFYDLLAYVIMPNHVHVVWQPLVSMSNTLRWLKGGTSHRAKRLLGLDAKAFWQEESYDHWIRSDKELGKVIDYVELNPVKAGLVTSRELWHWSSAHEADGKTVRSTTR